MEKILIVDDSQADRELLEQILLGTETDYQINCVGSGPEGLAKIEADHPDLVLLDLRMKELDGFETLKQIKAKWQDLPVVLVSSFTEDNDHLRGLQFGAQDFLSKPLINEEVRARIAAQLKIKKMQERSRWIAEKTNEGIKLLYRELEKNNIKLKELDTLKSEFISTVSHELRTPLAIIRQGVSLVGRKVLGEITPQQEEILSDVMDNVDRIIKIVNDLLDMSKLESGKAEIERKEVHVTDLINQAAKEIKIKADPKGVVVKTNLTEDLPTVFADKDKIHQVLINFLGNAVKFTPSGGEVSVTAQGLADMVEVAVTDTGVGIAAENIPKLFSKFQQFGRTAGPGEKGTGLGLAISKQIVELHGGRCRVESQPEKGSTFAFTIPQYQSPEQVCLNILGKAIEGNVAAADMGFALGLVKITNLATIRDKMGQEASSKATAAVLEAIRAHLTSPEAGVIPFPDVDGAFLLPLTNRAGALQVCEKVRHAINVKPLEYASQILSISLHFAVAVFPDQGTSAPKLIEAARLELTRQKKVLVFDETAELGRFLSHHLAKDNRFVFLQVEDMTQAIKRATEERPDLIICDGASTKINGYEMIGHLKEYQQTRDIAVVLLTSQVVASDPSQAILPSSTLVIKKTPEFDNLLRIIRNII